MSPMYKVCRAKYPFKYGLMPIEHDAEVKKVEAEPAPVEPVNATPSEVKVEEVKAPEAKVEEVTTTKVEEPATTTETESEQPTVEGTLLSSIKEFSRTSRRALAKDNILTVEALKEVIASEGGINSLEHIDETIGTTILKELEAWETKQTQQ